jgi:hypothetical protein
MSSSAKKITVTVPAVVHDTKLEDEIFHEFGAAKERHWTTKVTTTQTGSVLVEVDLAEIVATIAQTALYNSGKRASLLNGSIRAKVLEVESQEEREPSAWAGPIQVWTKELDDPFYPPGRKTRTKFVAELDEYRQAPDELEADGWTYQTTLNEEED